MRFLKIICAVLAALGLGLVTAHAAPDNLVRNGSFERGTNGWSVFGASRPTAGHCGTHALAFHGTLQSAPVRLERGRDYRVTFAYRGELRATVLMALPHAARWTVRTYNIRGAAEKIFIGFEGKGAVDCVTVMLAGPTRGEKERE